MIRLEHVALWSRDPERLKSYYVTHFQGIAGPMYQNPGKRFRSYFITFDSGLRLELMSVPDLISGGDPSGKKQGTGWTHIAFEVSSRDEVDLKASELSEAGFRIVDGPRVTGDGYYEFTTLDPENNRLEVTTSVHHQSSSRETPELTLQTSGMRFAVCLLPPGEPLPGWATGSPFWAVSQSREETSVVCPESQVPGEVEAERGWRMFRVKGTLDFTLTGILAHLLGPLRKGNIPTFVLSTYRTDYLLVQDHDYAKALSMLGGVCTIEYIGSSFENGWP